jgi:nucleotide-binding universal stress UspA family protein
MTSPSPTARPLSGFKYFDQLDGLLARLRPSGTDHDTAGNRRLFFDQYAQLLLLYYFNPAVTSLRGVREFTTLEKVQRTFGIRPTALGSLSEAARVFDPALLEPIIAELAQRALARPDTRPPGEREALAGLIAVDGSLLPALPRMAWALWQDAAHRAAKVHVAFAVWPGAPVRATVTAGNGSERDELRRMAKPGEFYVMDRGYIAYDLLRELDAAGSRFVQRLADNAVYEVASENPLTDADRRAGVVRDVMVRRLGTEGQKDELASPWRVVRTHGEEPGQRWVLVTNAVGLPAELVVLAYRHRWLVELFFRWLKCILGCRHLLAENQAGVTIQVYLAIIASLLIGLWTGAKPTKRAYELLCHYFNGWATAEEVERHLNTQKQRARPPGK